VEPPFETQNNSGTPLWKPTLRVEPPLWKTPGSATVKPMKSIVKKQNKQSLGYNTNRKLYNINDKYRIYK
jgi:hypothetical protein